MIFSYSLWQVGVPVYAEGTEVKPSEIAKRGLEEAKKKSVDVVIVDTAGRLQVIELLVSWFNISHILILLSFIYLFIYLF